MVVLFMLAQALARSARGPLERGVHLRVSDGALLPGRVQRVALPAAHPARVLVGDGSPLGARRPGGAAGRAYAQQRRRAPAAARRHLVGAAAGGARDACRAAPPPARRRRGRAPVRPRRRSGCFSCPPASPSTWRFLWLGVRRPAAVRQRAGVLGSPAHASHHGDLARRRGRGERGCGGWPRTASAPSWARACRPAACTAT